MGTTSSMSIRRAAVALAVAGLLAGCGGSADAGAGAATWATPADNGVAALAPEQILDRSRAALKAAKSFRVKGTVEADGNPMRLDLRISAADLHGTLSTQGATVEMLSVGGQRYIRPDEKFWAQNIGAQAAETMTTLMGDRWAIVAADDKDLGGLFTIADVDKLFDPDGTLTKSEATQVGGTPAVGLVDEGGDGGTLWVSRLGEPYPVRMDAPPTEKGEVTFAEFGATFTQIKKPAAGDVVDLEKLARR